MDILRLHESGLTKLLMKRSPLVRHLLAVFESILSRQLDCVFGLSI